MPRPKEHLWGGAGSEAAKREEVLLPSPPHPQQKARARPLSWSTGEPLKVLKQWCGMVRVGLEIT